MTWLKCVDEDEKRRLKDIYKDAKLAVTNAETSAFERLYTNLGDKGRVKRLDRFVKEREREKLVIWIK